MKEIKHQQEILYRRKHLSDKEKLEQLQKDLKRVEDKLDILTKKLEKHIDFIDKTYDGLKNPIEGVKRFLSR
jgi:vacuolar-type H+-ATPase subunit I/STV1